MWPLYTTPTGRRVDTCTMAAGSVQHPLLAAGRFSLQAQSALYTIPTSHGPIELGAKRPHIYMPTGQTIS